MRALLWMISGDAVPGGHRVQIEQTARHLRLVGVDIELSFRRDVVLSGFDLVHGFGLPLEDIRRCRLAKIPVVISTIYPGWEFALGQHIARGLLATVFWRARMGLSLLRAALRGGHVSKCRSLLERLEHLRVEYELADLLLPNSEAEARRLREDLRVTTPMHVVPNAVDADAFRLPDEGAHRSGALYVGRFEPHKNQLGLIRAMRGTGLTLTLVGPPHPHHLSYYAQCRREAGPDVTILEGLPHEELPGIYARAKVHILPSWMETTGLVSLEAALAGCNIVTTSRGFAKEYFGDLAWYCDPADPRSIRQALRTAYDAPFRTELRSRILQQFTWRHAAAATLAAYKSIMLGERGKLQDPYGSGPRPQSSRGVHENVVA